MLDRMVDNVSARWSMHTFNSVIYKYIHSNYNYYYYTLCEATVELYALLSVSEAHCTHGVTDSQNQNVNFVEETQKQHIMTNMHTLEHSTTCPL